MQILLFKSAAIAACLMAASAINAATSEFELENELSLPGQIGTAELSRITDDIRQGRAEVALDKINALIAGGMKTGPAYEIQGLALGKLGRIEESLAAFDIAKRLQPTSPSVFTNAGLVHWALGQTGAARDNFEAALLRDPRDRRANQYMGKIAESEGRTEDAIRHYETGISGTQERYLGVKPDLALLHIETQNVDRALELMTPWADAPDAPDVVLEVMARGEVANGNREAGIALLDRLVARGTSSDALVRRARFHLTDGEMTEAEDLLQRALIAFPKNAAVFFEYGNLMGALGRYDEAVGHYEAGLEHDPENKALLKGASLANYRMESLDEALTYANRLVEAGKPDAADHLWRGIVFEKAGGSEAAITDYRAAVALDPTNWTALNNLAYLLTDDEPQEAVRYAQSALNLAPQAAHQAVEDTLGLAQYRAGNIEAAQSIYESLHAKAPKAALPAYRLGVILISAGESSRGRDLLEKSLALGLSGSQAEDARTRMQQGG